jgi:hypothetical protein
MPDVPHVILKQIDALLSRPLRQAPLAELTRARVLAAVTCGLLLLNVLYTLALPAPSASWLWRVPGGVGSLGMLGTLVMIRRVRSIAAPALLLCGSMLWGITTLVLYRNAYISTHATLMLLPAFGVYLLGPRKGLLVTLLTLLLTGGITLFLVSPEGLQAPQPSSELLGTLRLASSLAMLSIWLLGALHSGAQDVAQETLERTLKELRDTERKLTSLFESTDDVLCSLDTEGRVLVANTAIRQAFVQRFGWAPVAGHPLFAGAERFRKVLRGQRLRFTELRRASSCSCETSPHARRRRPGWARCTGRWWMSRGRLAWRRSRQACSTTWATR